MKRECIIQMERFNMAKRLIILGAGGYGRTVVDLAEQLGYAPIITLDDKFTDFKLSTFRSYVDSNTEFVVAFGNNQFRLKWCNKIVESGAKLATLIHPTAYVSPKAKILEGCVVLPKAIVNTGVEVRRGSIINLGCIVDHDTVIDEGCHICVGAIIKGENTISSLQKIEAGTVIDRGMLK